MSNSPVFLLNSFYYYYYFYINFFQLAVRNTKRYEVFSAVRGCSTFNWWLVIWLDWLTKWTTPRFWRFLSQGGDFPKMNVPFFCLVGFYFIPRSMIDFRSTKKSQKMKMKIYNKLCLHQNIKYDYIYTYKLSFGTATKQFLPSPSSSLPPPPWLVHTPLFSVC